MPQDTACWICRRTVAEIIAVMGAEGEDEAWFKDEIANVRKAKDSVAENMGAWKGQLPEQFKDFELASIFQNADQFRSIKFLSQLVESGRGVVRELDEVSYRAHKGDPIQMGVAPTAKQEKLILERLNDFEKRTHRRLKREEDMRDLNYQRLGYIDRLKGLKFADGLDYLREAGEFYYDLELELLQRAMEEARQRRPVWKVGPVRLANFPREIPICNVCERLLREGQQVEFAAPKQEAS